MFMSRMIAFTTFDALTAHPSQSKKNRTMKAGAVRSLLCCMAILMVLLGAVSATAQNAGYFMYGEQFKFQKTGSPNGAGTALDRSGNLYVADTNLKMAGGDGLNIVYEVQAVNGAISATSKAVTLIGLWTAPSAVAVDASDNVYVADNGSTDPSADLAAELECPVLGIFGGADQAIPVAAIQAFRDALTTAGVENDLVVEPDAPHSFFDRKAAEFQAQSDDAWARVRRFISAHGAH